MNAKPLENATLTASVPHEVCVARQPILDSQCNVVAYELLFRQIGEETANFSNGSLATLSVLNNVFTNIGIDETLGSKKAFINFDAQTLESDFFAFLPSRIIVLEILETVDITDALMKRIRNLHDLGYTIALDDFIYRPGLEQLLAIADIVKLDLSLLDEAALIKHVKLLKSNRRQLLAEKVETHAQFELCKSLGFTLFQGFFFARPVKLVQADIPANTLRILDIMNNIMADADQVVLERALSHDLSLSYKLLRFVNSVGMSCGRELRNVAQAVNMLGRNQLYRWLSMILFTSSQDDLNQSNALLTAALYRGRLLEMLAEKRKLDSPSDFFILGAFSYLEALLNRRTALILKDMLIPLPIKQALIEQDGPYWPYLNLAITMEKGELAQIESAIGDLVLSFEDINLAQLMATAYSESFT